MHRTAKQHRACNATTVLPSCHRGYCSVSISLLHLQSSFQHSQPSALDCLSLMLPAHCKCCQQACKAQRYGSDRTCGRTCSLRSMSQHRSVTNTSPQVHPLLPRRAPVCPGRGRRLRAHHRRAVRLHQVWVSSADHSKSGCAAWWTRLLH